MVVNSGQADWGYKDMIIARKYRNSIRKSLSQRIKLILLLIFLFVALVIGGFSLNKQMWKDFETSNNQHFNNAKIEIDSDIMQIPITTGTEITVKLQNIVQIQTDLTEENKSYCVASPLINWQGFVPEYSNKINACQQKQNYLSQFLVNLGQITEYLKNEQELAVIIMIANLSTSENNQVEKWSEIESFWRLAVTNISQLTVSDQFEAIKTVAITNLTNVADAWKQLSSANQAENRQQFDEARTNLDAAYGSLAEISTNSSAEVENLLNLLNISYQETF